MTLDDSCLTGPSLIQIDCPRCNRWIRVKENPDRKYTCPHCQLSFTPKDMAVRNMGPGYEFQEKREHETGAVRSTDADNVRFDLISGVAMRRLAETYNEGATKYGEHNWRKGFKTSGLINHALRHIFLWLEGDDTEDHLTHAAWNLLTAIDFTETRPDLVDRYCDLDNTRKENDK